jgi:uncharacterized protein (DUF1330 family)
MMEVTNAVYPAHEQLQEFFGSPDDGPFVMVNLIKFKERAEYADDPSIDISGREAYALYGQAVSKVVEGRGGRVIYSGDVTGLLLGEVGELWDMVALVEYASQAAFMEQMSSPDRASIERHRHAGLAGQLNIRTKLRPT